MHSFVFSELRYAIRGLVARPLFALVAIASLALGIGVNTAMFSLFHQVVLRPLAVAEPARLVNLVTPGIKEGWTSSNSMGTRDEILSYPLLRDLQQQMPTQLSGIAGHRSLATTLGWDGQVRNTGGLLVSGNYFELLGLTPAAGRLIGDADDRAGAAAHVVVLSHAFWQNTLGGNADVLGWTLRVNGQPLTVIGVAPPGFAGTSFGTSADVFVPLSLAALLEPRSNHRLDERQSHWVYAFARLAPGVGIAQAQQALNLPFQRLIKEVELPLQTGLDEARRAEFAARQLLLVDGSRGQSRAAGRAAAPLALLLGVAALVLLIACLNIANLLLARGTARAGEFAVRASMGASRARLVRQLLLEALLLAGLGALASLPLATAASAALLSWIPDQAMRSLNTALDGTALQFTAAMAVIAALLFGLFPAWQVSRTAPMAALRGESGQSSSRSGNRFRSSVATAQIGLSMAALVLAGLFAKSLFNISNEQLGMQVDSLAVVSIVPIRNGYDDARMSALYEGLEQRLAALPGVTGVASSMVPLLANSEWESTVSVEGFDAGGEPIASAYNQVGVGFFDTVSIPLLAGRDFSLTDQRDSARVAIVNRRFAENFGLGAHPVGKRIGFGGELDTEIVGLVEDSKYGDVKDAPRPIVFTPRRQSEQQGAMNFYVRSSLPPATLLPLLPKVVAEFDPELPVTARTVSEQIARTVGVERFVSALSASFALLATLLAALGLYGVLSYMLSQRTREIGLRLALGAEPQRLARMVLGQVSRMTVLGGAFGLAAAVLLGHAAQSLLFGLQGHDPVVLLAATATLATVALASGWLPARRAARIDPMVALRHE